MEKWTKVIVNRNYEISDKGRVRSYNYHSKGKLLKPTKRGTSWFCVVLCDNYGKKAYSISNLVYESFCGKLPEGYSILHKDGNPSNNSLDNLVPMKRSDKAFVKANKDVELLPSKSFRYEYFINNDGKPKPIGGTADLMTKYGIRTRQNVEQRFLTWERRKTNSKWHSSNGVKFGEDFIIRKKCVVDTKKEIRIAKCEAKYGIVVTKRKDK